MATTTVAAAGTALAVYYYTKRYNRSLCGIDDDREVETHVAAHRAPKSFFEDLYFFSEALRYTYAETFGRWRSMDLLVGLAYLCRKEGCEHPVADIARHGSVFGTDIPRATALDQIKKLERYFRYCSGLRERRPLHQRRYFVETLGIQEEDILVQELRSGVLKPSYILTRDHQLGAIILAIRGTHSLKDAFTSLTASSKPHHVFDSNGVVLGYSHFGMLAAARWLKSQVADQLVETLQANPGFRLHIVGHSMGGGTGAMLTMMLRESGGPFAEVTCTAIACPACMTLELAKSCAGYVTTVIHGADVIPTMSPGSVDALRQQVASSSWGRDMRRDFINRGEIRYIRNTAFGRAMENYVWKVTTNATSSLSWTASRLASCYPRQDTIAWRSIMPVHTVNKKSTGNAKRHKPHDDPTSLQQSTSWGGRVGQNLMQLFGSLREGKRLHDKEIDCGLQDREGREGREEKDRGEEIGNRELSDTENSDSDDRDTERLLGEIGDEEGLLHAEAGLRLREVESAVNAAELEERGVQGTSKGNGFDSQLKVPSVIRPGNYGSESRETRDEYQRRRSTTDRRQKRTKRDNKDAPVQDVSPATWRRMMYPAGRIMHLVPAELVKVDAGVMEIKGEYGNLESILKEGIDADVGERTDTETTCCPSGQPSSDEPMVLLDGVPQEAYGRIKLCRTVLSDHVIPNYLKSLETFVQTYYTL